MRDEPGECCVCGEHADRTALANRVLGKNFTDRSLFHGVGLLVCQACVWMSSGVGVRSVRPWSIVCAPGMTLPPHADKAQPWIGDTPGLCLTTRKNTKPIIDILTHPPAGEWVVTVSTSGQKHVLPYAEVNHGSEAFTVRFETVNVSSTPDEFTQVIDAVGHLRALGHRMDDIVQGTPTLRACESVDEVHAWETFNTILKRFHNSPVIELAGWLLTKENINEYR